MNKFEKLVEYIINEDDDKAQDLFHKIVVEKSREIYNDLVNEQDQTDDFVDDIESDEEGTDTNMDMGMDMDDSEMDDAGDAGDDMEASEEELEDRVVDLEAALDELKAEFDAMVADDSGDMETADMDSEEEVEEDFDDGFEEDYDVFSEDDEAEDDMVREYVEKVAHPSKGEGSEVAKGGSVSVNKQSIVAKKNDMGGTTANMVKGGTSGTRPAPKAQEISSGNRNVPGGDAAPLQKAPAPKRGE